MYVYQEKKIYKYPSQYTVPDRINIIRAHLNRGMSFYDIADLFGVTPDAIRYSWNRYAPEQKDFREAKRPYTPNAECKNPVMVERRKREGRYRYAKLMRDEGLTLREIAALMGNKTGQSAAVYLSKKISHSIYNQTDVYKDYLHELAKMNDEEIESAKKTV